LAILLLSNGLKEVVKDLIVEIVTEIVVIEEGDLTLALIVENPDILREIAILDRIHPVDGVLIEGEILDLREGTPAGMSEEDVEVLDLVLLDEMNLDLPEDPINLREEPINLQEDRINLREEMIKLRLDLLEEVKLLKSKMMISKFPINFIESCVIVTSFINLLLRF